MLTAEGRVKVLDFGIARRFADPAIVPDTQLATLEPGLTAGTLAYMSPEVLRGGVADDAPTSSGDRRRALRTARGPSSVPGQYEHRSQLGILRARRRRFRARCLGPLCALSRALSRKGSRAPIPSTPVRFGLRSRMIPADAAPGTSAPRARCAHPEGRWPAGQGNSPRPAACCPLENLSAITIVTSSLTA